MVAVEERGECFVVLYFFFIFFLFFFIFVYSQGSEGLTIWGVVWFCLKLVIIGLLSFSVRVLLLLFLCPFDGCSH